MDNKIKNIEDKVIKKLKTIKDLELPINIYDLGLEQLRNANSKTM